MSYTPIDYPNCQITMKQTSNNKSLSLKADGMEAVNLDGSKANYQPQNAVIYDSSSKVMTNLASGQLTMNGIGASTSYAQYSSSAVFITDGDTKSIQLGVSNIGVDGNSGLTGQILTNDIDNNLEWITPEPPVTIINYYISQTNPLFQYPPQPPSSTIINTYGYYGWAFQNSVASRKIDWYFAPDYDMEVQDVLGLYMNYFNITTTSNDNLPFITIYTKPLGSGDIIPGFAHSKKIFVANFTPASNSPYSSFMNITGVQPIPFAYGHQQVGMIEIETDGTYTPTMKVLAISVGTDSEAPLNQVNFVMSKVGVCVAGLNNESVLNPLDSTLIGSWVSTATSNLNMSSFSIDASANNLSIGTLTSTGLILGKSGNTTNIRGNLQINASSGTSGQYLTSAGSGGVPTWTTSTSGWVGTATSNLNMSSFSIDASANNLSIGTLTSTGVVLGKSGATTNLQGIVKINNSAGSSGQILTSTGASTAPTWQSAPASSWVGTATSNLNMSSFSIDASANNLSIGTLTSTALTLGKSGNTTNIQGNLQIAGAAGTSGQYLTSSGTGAVPTWTTSTAGWVGTATSDLNMSSYNITSASALSIGNTSVATKLIGNVDISNNLTFANGTLVTYGGTSVGTTAVSINIGTAYPNPNTDFTLFLTGTTANQILTMATARAGYKITIYNKSTQNWTMNCSGSDLFYGNFVIPATGLATFRNGIPSIKCFTFLQQSLAYNLISESCSTTGTYFGPLWANNNGNAPINLMGNQEQLFPSTTPYTMPTFANSMISSFLLCTGTASVINLQSYPLLSQLTTGYVIIIRNNTLLPLTIQGASPNPTAIYFTGSTTSSPTFTLPTTMTMTMKVISGYGYFITSLY